jgi:DNA-binding NarL/FixJ family response regulator
VTIRVMVVDDQVMIRDGLATLLSAAPDIEVVGLAGDGRAAVDLCRELSPDVVVMDVRMPVLDGLAATAEIVGAPAEHDDAPTRPKVLILTTFDVDEYVYEALSAGASGFLLKDASGADLVTAVRVIAEGDALLAPSVTRRLIDDFARLKRQERPSGPPPAALTPREVDVLRLVARGMSNAEIAEELTISPATAKTHVAHLLTKLDARDRIQLVIIAYQAGLCDSGGRPPRG